MLETVRLLGDRVGHPLATRLLPTLFDGRTRVARTALAEIRATYPDQVFDTVIRQTVRLREAARRGVPVSRMDPRCYGFLDHMSLALELELIRDGEVPLVSAALDSREGARRSHALERSPLILEGVTDLR